MVGVPGKPAKTARAGAPAAVPQPLVRFAALYLNPSCPDNGGVLDRRWLVRALLREKMVARATLSTPPAPPRRAPDRSRAWLGGSGESTDQIGLIDENTRATSLRSYAAEPDVLIDQLEEDEAIMEADTLLLTVPNQLGVDYNEHVIEAILTHVAPALGWMSLDP